MQLKKISPPANAGRTESIDPRVVNSALSPHGLISRLNDLKSQVGLDDQRGRIRIARNDGRVFCLAELAVTAKSFVLLQVQTCSMLDGRLAIARKMLFIAIWCCLMLLAQISTGLRQSVSVEWSRRHAGGGDMLLIEELAESGFRPTANGIPDSRPMRLIDFLLADPLLLSALIATLAIISALSVAIVKTIPPKAIWFIGETLCGIPTPSRLRKIASEFEQEILCVLER